jgi:predicted O-methyltransferase YrrM
MTSSISIQESFGFMLKEEIRELKRLCALLPDAPTVINIGAGPGTSGLAFIESRNDLVLYTVDIQDESSPHGSLFGERVSFSDGGFGHLANKRWFQVHGDSIDIGREWTNDKVDLVFVDGLHTYDGCAGDIKAWLPHIKDSGFIAVHDYDKSGKYHRTTSDDSWKSQLHPHAFEKSVTRAVDELLRPRHELFSLVGAMVTFRIRRTGNANV